MKNIQRFLCVVLISFSLVLICKASDVFSEKADLAKWNGQYKEAFTLYLKSAELGNPESEFQIAIAYKLGQGVERDTVKALEWHRRAGEHGLCLAQWVLGDIYRYGRLDQEPDYGKAIKWYLMGSDHDTTDGCKLWSIKNIGDMYYRGVGVARNIEEGVKWYRRAAYAGWSRSQLELGVMLRDGINVRQDYTEAVILFRMAATGGTSGGDPNGQRYLGEMYEHGKGLLQNYKEAAKWYWESASQGNYWAQKDLARMYRDGLGVEQDLGEAYIWYSIAAVDEDEWQNFEATKQRDLIAKLLDPKSLNDLQEKTKERYKFIETRRYHGA